LFLVKHRKTPLILVAIAATAVAILLASRPSPPAAAEDPLDFVLARRLNGWPMENKPTLDEVIAGLSKANDIHIVLDWPELKSAGVSPGPRQMIIYGQINSLGTTIRSFVQAFSPSPTRTDLAPPLQFSLTADGALFVSIDHDASRKMRIYDVRDLLSDAYWGTPADRARADDFRKDRERTLCLLVLNRLHATDYTLSPTGYIINMDGVEGGHGMLMVTTTPAQHRRLERILAALRRMNREGATEKMRLP
jgi:hypothetical protein